MENFSRRDFFKLAGTFAAGTILSNFNFARAQAPVIGSREVTSKAAGSKAKVYFTDKDNIK